MSFFIRSSKLTANTASTAKTFALRQSTPNKYIYQKNFRRAFANTSVNMGVHNITSKAEFEETLQKNEVVVLDAFATWCGPCKVIAPQVATYSETYKTAHFIKIDVDELPDVAAELGIRAMPTFLIFKNGDKVKEIVGANPKALVAAIEESL